MPFMEVLTKLLRECVRPNVVIISLLLTTLTEYRPTLACFDLLVQEKEALLCSPYTGILPPPEATSKVAMLQVSAAEFSKTGAFLTRANFTNLYNLNFLQITTSQLRLIKRGAFQDLQKLEHLDLSMNEITSIEDGAFSGLRLKKLILSGNVGLHFPANAFVGATINSFVAKDCSLKLLSYSLFSTTHTRHIDVAKNNIRSLDPRFATIIQPMSQRNTQDILAWGSLDVTDNPLRCDCSLYWFTQLIERQRQAIEPLLKAEGFKQVEGNLLNKQRPRSIRNTGVAPHDLSSSTEQVKRMYRLDIRCAEPEALKERRLPQPRDLLCPPPRIVGVDVMLFDGSPDTAQVTCYARGKPAPSLAWTYKVHDQEVQRILKSPATRILGDDSMPIEPSQATEEVQLALNVSLSPREVRDFTCVTWSTNSLETLAFSSMTGHEASRSLGQQNRLLQDYDGPVRTSATSMTPLHLKDMIDNDNLHQVNVRLKGPSQRIPITAVEPPQPGEQSSSNVDGTLDTSDLDSSKLQAEGYLQEFFVKRFTLLELIGAVIGTFALTLLLLCCVKRCIPLYCRAPHRDKSSHNKQQLLGSGAQKNRFALLGDETRYHNSPKSLFGQNRDTDAGRGLSDISCTSGTIMPGQQLDNFSHDDTFGSPIIPIGMVATSSTAGGSSSNANTAAYWRLPEYTYSISTGHEYDMPRLSDPLAGAMPIATSVSSNVTFPVSTKVYQEPPSGTLGGRSQSPRKTREGDHGEQVALPQMAAVPPIASYSDAMAQASVGPSYLLVNNRLAATSPLLPQFHLHGGTSSVNFGNFHGGTAYFNPGIGSPNLRALGPIHNAGTLSPSNSIVANSYLMGSPFNSVGIHSPGLQHPALYQSALLCDQSLAGTPSDALTRRSYYTSGNQQSSPVSRGKHLAMAEEDKEEETDEQLDAICTVNGHVTEGDTSVWSCQSSAGKPIPSSRKTGI